MTRFKSFLTGVSALGVAAMLAQPAAAMTCDEWNAMDEDAQMQAVNDNQWNEAVHDQETDLDESAEAGASADVDAGEDAGGSVEVEVEEASDAETPRDADRAEDRGAESIQVIRDECEKDPNTDIGQLFEHQPLN